MVSTYALSADYLTSAFLDLIGIGEDSEQSIFDIEPLIRQHSAHATCPHDSRAGAAFAFVAKDTRAGPATHLVSYSWSQRVLEIVHALKAHCWQRQLDTWAMRLWMCVLCINQHRVKERLAAGESVPFGEFSASFGSQVQHIGRVLAVCSPWQKPTLITRAWCVYELFMAIMTPDVTLELIFPPEQEDEFANTLQTSGLQGVWNAIAACRVQSAKATIESDRRNILRLVESGPGCSALNLIVTSHLHKWLASTATHHARALLTQQSQSSEQSASIARNCAQVVEYLFEVAQYDSVIDFGMQCLQCTHGDTTRGKLRLLIGRASVSQGSLLEAKIHFQKAIDIYRSSETSTAQEHWQDTAACLQHMGTVHRQLGENAAALKLYKEAMLLFEVAGAGESALAATCLRSIGAVHTEQGQYPESLWHYTQAMKVYKKAGAIFSPDSAKCLQNIGIVKMQAGQQSKALDLFLLALDVYKALGLEAKTPEAAFCIQNVGRVHRKRGEELQALSCFEDALLIYRTSRAEKSSDAVRALVHVGILRKRQGDFAAARDCYSRAMKIYRDQQKDATAEFASCLWNCAMLQSGVAAQSALFCQALHLFETLGCVCREALELVDLPTRDSNASLTVGSLRCCLEAIANCPQVHKEP
eukprot:TRINITY_DN7474_c0_g1_i1.p1 TRINITY_DN7474_c0_g1~~TRINITY_DN7474_c0_g1_i1.p1  ORF type:complete len:644 (+),score=116.58 TRINITY_DN7474_c0_g1_i1:50-1981(+)